MGKPILVSSEFPKGMTKVLDSYLERIANEYRDKRYYIVKAVNTTASAGQILRETDFT